VPDRHPDFDDGWMERKAGDSHSMKASPDQEISAPKFEKAKKAPGCGTLTKGVKLGEEMLNRLTDI